MLEGRGGGLPQSAIAPPRNSLKLYRLRDEFGIKEGDFLDVELQAVH